MSFRVDRYRFQGKDIITEMRYGGQSPRKIGQKSEERGGSRRPEVRGRVFFYGGQREVLKIDK